MFVLVFASLGVSCLVLSCLVLTTLFSGLVLLLSSCIVTLFRCLTLSSSRLI